MTPAYLGWFGLTEIPFSKEIEDEALWLPPSKQSVVEDLEETLGERASAVLVGEPGVGKTCVLRALRHRLPQQGYRLTYCHNVTLGRRDFYRQLCITLGLSTASTAAAVFFAVSTHVEDLGRERVHPVLLLDEAHLLHQDTLDHLHILLNYEWDRRALLSVILVGLPELEDRLTMRRNRSLWSRLHHRLRIEPLTEQDTGAYLRARTARVGCDREVFAAEAVAHLHEAAQGAHRDLDRLATECLRVAQRRKRTTVDGTIAAGIIEADQRRMEGAQ